jgi:hypothetical protein
MINDLLYHTNVDLNLIKHQHENQSDESNERTVFKHVDWIKILFNQKVASGRLIVIIKIINSDQPTHLLIIPQSDSVRRKDIV